MNIGSLSFSSGVKLNENHLTNKMLNSTNKIDPSFSLTFNKSGTQSKESTAGGRRLIVPRSPMHFGKHRKDSTLQVIRTP